MLVNPYKTGTGKHRMVKLFHENGFKVRASQTHQFNNSPTKTESNLRKDGFKIEYEKDPNSKDNWHVMEFDPNNPSVSFPKARKFEKPRTYPKMQPNVMVVPKPVKDAMEEKLKPQPKFGMDFCPKHGAFPFGSSCTGCIK